MREIIFRAWDCIDKEMLNPVEFEQSGSFISPVDGTALVLDEEEKEMISTHLQPLEFIGLKDKNLNLIFDGDIVKAEDEMNGHKFNGIVKYFPRLAYFALEIIGDPDNGHLRLNDTKRDELEVIGNIYQNPELLVDADKGEQPK
jgi:uncharacterized phage protein (TIGR01671 family)